LAKRARVTTPTAVSQRHRDRLFMNIQADVIVSSMARLLCMRLYEGIALATLDTCIL
jgi:hypothetical protein